MAAINLDFGEDAVGGGMLPEGMVILQVADVEVKDKKGTEDGSSRYLQFKMVPVFPDEVQNCRPVWHISSLKPEARWALKDTLEAITGQDWSEDGMDLDPRDLIGCTVQASIIHEMYNSKPQAKIKDLFRHE